MNNYIVHFVLFVSIFSVISNPLIAGFGEFGGSASPIEYSTGATGTSPESLGPGTSTDNAIVRWDGDSGSLIQDSPTGPFATDGGKLGVGYTPNSYTPASAIHTFDSDASTGTDLGITIEQLSTGDSKLQIVRGPTRWQIGVDQSDSDALKIGDVSDLANAKWIFKTDDSLEGQHIEVNTESNDRILIGKDAGEAVLDLRGDSALDKPRLDFTRNASDDDTPNFNETIRLDGDSLLVFEGLGAVNQHKFMNQAGSEILSVESLSSSNNANLTIQVTNSANSEPSIDVRTLGSLGKSPRITYEVSGDGSWTSCMDNSDDSMKLDKGSVCGADTALKIDTNKDVTIYEDFHVVKTSDFDGLVNVDNDVDIRGSGGATDVSIYSAVNTDATLTLETPIGTGDAKIFFNVDAGIPTWTQCVDNTDDNMKISYGQLCSSASTLMTLKSNLEVNVNGLLTALDDFTLSTSDSSVTPKAKIVAPLNKDAILEIETPNGTGDPRINFNADTSTISWTQCVDNDDTSDMKFTADNVCSSAGTLLTLKQDLSVRVAGPLAVQGWTSCVDSGDSNKFKINKGFVCGTDTAITIDPTTLDITGNFSATSATDNFYINSASSASALRLVEDTGVTPYEYAVIGGCNANDSFCISNVTGGQTGASSPFIIDTQGNIGLGGAVPATTGLSMIRSEGSPVTMYIENSSGVANEAFYRVRSNTAGSAGISLEKNTASDATTWMLCNDASESFHIGNVIPEGGNNCGDNDYMSVASTTGHQTTINSRDFIIQGDPAATFDPLVSVKSTGTKPSIIEINANSSDSAIVFRTETGVTEERFIICQDAVTGAANDETLFLTGDNSITCASQGNVSMKIKHSDKSVELRNKVRVMSLTGLEEEELTFCPSPVAGASNDSMYIKMNGGDCSTLTNAAMEIDPNNYVSLVETVNNTTALAANLYIDPTTGELRRSTSSMRYKKDINDISELIDTSKLYDMRPVSFKSKNENDTSTHLGFIAEELDELLPELVTYNEFGQPENVQYSRITSVIVAEMKKLKKESEGLRSEVDSLKAELEKIKLNLEILLK